MRYVVYSHSHFDHAAGGAVFADTARFVAHEHMLRNLDGRYPHMPGDMVDRNRNGAIDPDEIDIPTKAAPGICGMGPGFFGVDRSRQERPGAAGGAAGRHPSARRRLLGAHADHARRADGGPDSSRAEPFRRRHRDATSRTQRVLFATEFLADALVTTNPRSLPSTCSAFDRHPLSEWIRFLPDGRGPGLRSAWRPVTATCSTSPS